MCLARVPSHTADAISNVITMRMKNGETQQQTSQVVSLPEHQRAWLCPSGGLLQYYQQLLEGHDNGACPIVVVARTC